MDTNLLYRNATTLLLVTAASALSGVLGCAPTEPVVEPPSTKPDSQFLAAATASSGDVYATGYVNIPVGQGNLHTSLLLLRKYNASQQPVWERKYPDATQGGYIEAMSASLPTDNGGKYIQVANDGSVYVLARLQQPENYGAAHNKLDYDIALLKYSASGSLLWTRYIDWLAKDFPRGLEIGADGNIYLQGRTIKSTIPGIPEVYPSTDLFNEFVASYNSNGDIRWRVNFNASGQNYVGNMQFRSDGIYLTAATATNTCGNLYKVDYSGHLALVSSGPLPVCPDRAMLVGDSAVFTPATTGNAESSIVALDNPSSLAASLAWHDIAISYLQVDSEAYAFTELWGQLPDRRQPDAFFALLGGFYSFTDADGEMQTEQKSLLVHATTSGNVLSIVPIDHDYITSAHLTGGLNLYQRASGDVVISVYIEEIGYPLDSSIQLVDYDDHAVTTYSFTGWLNSVTGLETGQQPVIAGSRLVNEIWTPSLWRLDQGQ